MEDAGMEGGFVRFDSQVKYGILAQGDAEVYVRPRSRPDWRENPWDHAGGVVVAEEAGRTTLYFTPDYEVRDGGVVRYVRVDSMRVARVEAPAEVAALVCRTGRKAASAIPIRPSQIAAGRRPCCTGRT